MDYGKGCCSTSIYIVALGICFRDLDSKIHESLVDTVANLLRPDISPSSSSPSGVRTSLLHARPNSTWWGAFVRWIFVKEKSICTLLFVCTTEHIKKGKIHTYTYICLCHVHSGKEANNHRVSFCVLQVHACSVGMLATGNGRELNRCSHDTYVRLYIYVRNRP